jgi:hypothetical protein
MTAGGFDVLRWGVVLLLWSRSVLAEVPVEVITGMADIGVDVQGLLSLAFVVAAVVVGGFMSYVVFRQIVELATDASGHFDESDYTDEELDELDDMDGEFMSGDLGPKYDDLLIELGRKRRY